MADNNPAPPREPGRTARLILNKKAARKGLERARRSVQERAAAPAGYQATGSGPTDFPLFERLSPELRLMTWKQASFSWFDAFIPMIDMGPRGPVAAGGEFDLDIDTRVTGRDLLVKEVRGCLPVSNVSQACSESRETYERARAGESRYIYNIELEVGFNAYLQEIPHYLPELFGHLGPPVAISVTMTPTPLHTRNCLIRSMLDVDDRIDTLYLLMDDQNLEDQHSWAEIMRTGPGQYYRMKQTGVVEDDDCFGILFPTFGKPEKVRGYDPYLCHKIIYHHGHEGKCTMWAEKAHMTTRLSGEVVLPWVGAARCPFFTGQEAALNEFKGRFLSEPRLRHVGILYPTHQCMDSE